ncbi:AsmA-like C-terminal region-containing protein [Sulfitobacter aestuarii]|uniref:AsmA-like C-terminal region-containing protein n=1 Tax=Sulfitobacter aestuarii TaxID=2161676 RepID=A0ABW5U3B7_9RHOB
MTENSPDPAAEAEPAAASSPAPEPDAPRKRRRPKLRRAGLWSLIGVLVFAGVAAGAVMLMIGRPLSPPHWLQQRIETRIATAMPQARVSFGEMVFVLDEGWRPRVRLRDVVLRSPAGAEIVSFNEIRASFAFEPLLRGEIQPRRLALSGVFVTLRRDAEGRVALSAGAGPRPPMRRAGTVPELIGGIDEVLQQPSLQALRSVDLQALTLRYEDAVSQRGWTIDGGRLSLSREDDHLALAADLALLGGGAGVASLSANYDSRIGETAAAFGVSFDGVAARDIAAQSPVFAWLDVLRAPISGSVRSGLRSDGRFAPLNATLQIGAGVLQPNDGTRAIPFEGARSYFRYQPSRRMLHFDELSLDSKWVSGKASGSARLDGIGEGRLDALVAQFRLNDLVANPGELYPAPVALSEAEIDVQVRFDPFRVELGRLQIRDQGQVLQIDGALRAEPEGWRLALDGGLDGIAPERLLELWPEALKPKTRRWVVENVRDGMLRDIDLALRLAPDHPPQPYMAFDFEAASVRFMKTMPLITGGRGHASLIGDRFVVAVDQGEVIAPQGGAVTLDGSAFIMPDVKVKDGAPAIVRLRTDSSLTAALALLNRPPMSVMDRTGLPVTLADGRARLEGTLAFPLKKGGKPKDVEYHVTGNLEDLSSDRLVKGRDLRAAELELTADNTQVSIGGKARLDGVPFEGAWAQAIGPGSDRSSLQGSIALSPQTLDAFDIALPPGTLSGRGSGTIRVDLHKGNPPRFSLESDLTGLRLAVPQLAWVKPAAQSGRLSLSGTLGAVPQVEKLEIAGAGLSAKGAISLTEAGSLERLRFERVALDGWLDVPVDLIGQGKGRPVQVALRGGTLDMRRAKFGKSPTRGPPGPPLLLSLARLQITDKIALTQMQGSFATQGGLDGSFTARLNGGAPVEGRVIPQNGRSAVRLLSPDAGAVLRSAGLAEQVVGGALELTLLPVGSGGAFDGQLAISDVRIRNAPAMAALLNAVSVVGLINELNGDGIYFDEVEADFRLTPAQITLSKASAIGASMGISMDGIYALESGLIDMQGVVSPVYMLNSIGSFLTRKGEGLIGFNYNLGGSAAAPQVSVNPLSALTPGMFREIFRAPPPELPPVEGAAQRPRDPAPQPRPRHVPAHRDNTVAGPYGGR